MIGEGRYAEALTFFQGLYEREPSGFHAWLFARIDEDRVRAGETVDRALREGRTHPGIEWLATSRRAADLALEGKIEEALKLVEGSTAGARIDPASVFQERAGYAAMIGNLDKALSLIKRARRLDPMDPGIHSDLVAILRLRGDVGEMTEEIRNPPRYRRYSYIGAAEATLSANLGDRQSALEAWRRVLELPLDPYGLRSARAHAYEALGDHAAAVEEIKAEARLLRHGIAHRIYLAFDLMARDRSAAEAAIQSEYERNPRLFETIRAMAWVDFCRGRYRESADLYTRALALAPGEPDLWVARAAVRMRQGANDLAEKDLSRALKLYDRNPGALRELGRIHLDAGDWTRCERDFSTLALAEDPEPEDLRLYSRCSRGSGHAERGIAALDKALENAPGIGRFIDLARVYVEAKQAAKKP
ncbi:MAG: tetratricopeptide repeat protein [Elusimicrobiota bacterium]|nr:MAG: tetratricopeptide repeat protein [Elusimicrobiota bacterium]